MFLFFVASMFSISLASLFFYHVYLVSKNMTTLEAFRAPVTRNGPDKMAFHLGRLANFQEVFGDNRLLWFFPVFTSFGDGVTFPQRAALDEEAGLLPSSSTMPTVYPSEEHVPMMAKDEDTAAAALSSSSSSNSSNNSGLLNNGDVKM